MAKIKINSSLKTKDDIILKELLGIYFDNKIVYKEENINVTILLEDNKIKLSRVTDEYEIIIDFIRNKKTEGVYYIKSHQLKMDLCVKTNILDIKDNKIVIEYELNLNGEDMGIFKFEIKYEVI
jgi:uncharacterized beta-barrel protein YwiB (DUF1934 family)